MKIKVIAGLMAVSLLTVYFYTDSTPTQINKFSDAALVQIMKDEGYRSVKNVDDGVILIRIDGDAYLLLNNNDDGDLQTYYALRGSTLTYQAINEWNKTRRLSRAYLDSDLHPTLESDLLANGGLTIKKITEFFHVFEFSVGNFVNFIDEHQRDQVKPVNGVTM